MPRKEFASRDVILFPFKWRTRNTDTRENTRADIWGTSLFDIFNHSNLKNIESLYYFSMIKSWPVDIAGYIFIVSIYLITFVNLRRNVVVIWKMSYEKYREALDFVEVGTCPFPISIYCSDLDSVSLICLVLAMSSLRSHSVLRLKKES